MTDHPSLELQGQLIRIRSGDMNLTEKMTREMNGFFKLIGEDPLLIPKEGEWTSELDLLRKIKEQYKTRLLDKMPHYRSLPPHLSMAVLLPTGSVDRSFDFPLDGSPITVVVQPNDDILIGGNFSVAEGVNRSGIVRVHGHPERVHPIEFVSAQYSVNEGVGAATISVQRAGDTTGSASVDFATSDGTARAGWDYVAQTGRLTFAPLEVMKTITIGLIASALIRVDETVNVRLTNPSSGAQLGENTAATITILDDHTVPQFVTDSLLVNENAGLAAVTLRRSGDLSQAITLDYSTSDGSAAAVGVYGKLPIMPAVEAEAKRRGIKLVAVPTEQACQLLGSVKRGGRCKPSAGRLLP
jgi:hypothetical protein